MVYAKKTCMGSFWWETYLGDVGEELPQQPNRPLVPIGNHLLLVFGAQSEDVDFLEGIAN